MNIQAIFLQYCNSAFQSKDSKVSFLEREVQLSLAGPEENLPRMNHGISVSLQFDTTIDNTVCEAEKIKASIINILL